MDSLASSTTGERLSLGHMRSERPARWGRHLAHTINTGKVRADTNGISNVRPLVNDSKPMGKQSNLTSTPSGDKVLFLYHTGFLIFNLQYLQYVYINQHKAK